MSIFTMVTADEAIEQGLGPAAFLSIATRNDAAGKPAEAQAARLLAREIAEKLGIRYEGRRRSNNDNRRHQHRRAA